MSQQATPPAAAPNRRRIAIGVGLALLGLVLCIGLWALAQRLTSQGAPAATATTEAQPTEVPTTVNYPLADQVYESPQGNEYNAVWDQNGWLHQPSLPAGPQRIAHEVSFTIVPGNYVFNGVECSLYLDEARAGDGGELVAERGNGLKFSVTTADGGEAWGRVACRHSEASGFSIEFRGP